MFARWMVDNQPALSRLLTIRTLPWTWPALADYYPEVGQRLGIFMIEASRIRRPRFPWCSIIGVGLRPEWFEKAVVWCGLPSEFPRLSGQAT